MNEPFAAQPEELNQRCPNCGTAMDDRFCKHCGQENRDPKRSVGLFLTEMLSDFFSFDSKIFRTLLPLFLRPGFLTQEFFAGRRIRYVPPLRLYLTCSVIFFIALSYQFRAQMKQREAVEAEAAFRKALKDDSLKVASGISSDSGRVKVGIFSDGVKPGRKSNIQIHLPGVSEKSVKEYALKNGISGIVNKITESLPTAMFILMPCFALLLKLLYVGSGRYYLEHLIFALHVHAFFFISQLIIILCTLALAELGYELSAVSSVLILIIFLVYPFIALLKFYGQRWWTTIWKFLLLIFMYLIVLIIGVMGIFTFTFHNISS